MDYKKRAWYSVIRRKGKSLILFAVIFILCNVLAGAVSIHQATSEVEKKIKTQLGAKATISLDYDEVDQLSKDNPNIFESLKFPDEKVINEIGSLPQVKYYDYSFSNGVNANKVKSYSNEENENGVVMGPGMGGKYYFNIVGVNNPETAAVKDGKIKIVEGKSFTKDQVDSGKNVVLISKKVAEKNNLSVGGKLVLDYNQADMNSMAMNDDGKESEDAIKTEIATKEYVYDIVGIFEPVKVELKKDATQDQKMNQSFNDEMQQNTFYMPNKTVKKDNADFMRVVAAKFPSQFENVEETINEMTSYIEPHFTLKSPEDIESFRQEATALLPDKKMFKIYVSSDQYDSIAGPVKSMDKLSRYVMIIAIIASLFIISLVVLLFLRDRKHELGVYLALGDRKWHVLMQIVIEVFLIGIVAITLAMFTGNILAKGVSQSLIENQMSAKSSQDMSFNQDDYVYSTMNTTEIGTEDVADNYNVSLSLPYVLIFYIAGLLTILLSTVIPLLYTLRLNPRKIMM